MKLTMACFVLMLSVSAGLVSCKKKDPVPVTSAPTPDPDTPTPSTPPPDTCDITYTDNYINDTIFPSPYLMTYPGSEWHYDNGTTSTCSSWELVGVAVKTNETGCPEVTRTFHVLPRIDFGYIMNNCTVSTTDPVKSKVHPLLDTVVGQFALYYENYGEPAPFYGGSRNYTLEVVELLSSMTVLGTTYNDVIHVRTITDEYDNDMGASQSTTDNFYARNVGLIQWVSVAYGMTMTKKLTSYTIGPH